MGKVGWEGVWNMVFVCIVCVCVLLQWQQVEDLRGELLAKKRRLSHGVSEEHTELGRLRTAPTELCGHHPKQRRQRAAFAIATVVLIATGARRAR